MSSLSNGWVRNLVFVNSDNGVTAANESTWITIENIKPLGRKGRHGISINGSTHCLASGVYFELTDTDPPTVRNDSLGYNDYWIHAFTMAHKTARSVAMNLNAAADYPPITLDYHRNGPLENLITNNQFGPPLLRPFTGPPWFSRRIVLLSKEMSVYVRLELYGQVKGFHIHILRNPDLGRIARGAENEKADADRGVRF